MHAAKQHKSKRQDFSDLDISLQVDNETLEELQTLEGQDVVRVFVWEDSIASALDASELSDITADMDVYLADGVLFELYGVLCYLALDSDPLDSMVGIMRYMDELIEFGASLNEIAADTEQNLVLVLSHGNESPIYLNTGAWALSQWEELPE